MSSRSATTIAALGVLGLLAGCGGGEPPEPTAAERFQQQAVGVQLRMTGGEEPVTVEAHGPAMTDEMLTGLLQFHSLRNLSLEGAQVTDAGMETIARLRQLRGLNLSDTRITDEGLARLEPLSRLEQLSLQNLPVTGAGLQHLAGLKSLQTLGLKGTQIGDDDLAWLAPLQQLTKLALDGTRVSGPGLADLDGLRRLHVLSVGGAQVTDDSLLAVHSLKGLQVLYVIDSPNVTDAWLEQMPADTSLRSVNLMGTQVTPEAVDALSRRLRSLTVRVLDSAPDQPRRPAPRRVAS